MSRLSINPKDSSTAQFHGYMLSAVAPRPIAFASTLDRKGSINLSPFSFFNAFSANPPVLIFSPARRVRDNTTKDTLENIYEVPEVGINIVDYNMVQQMSLASTEYDKGVNEFEKSGLSAVQSDLIRPPLVKESPVQFECKVKEIKPLGDNGGAGNLIICEVLMMHIDRVVLDENEKINTKKIDVVGRMGGDWYVRANGDSLFEVEKPIRTKGIGIDLLPENIKNSKILTGNDLGMLGNQESLPSKEEVDLFLKSEEATNLLHNGSDLHVKAQELLQAGDVRKAMLLLHVTS